jgi:hypothetical protein
MGRNKPSLGQARSSPLVTKMSLSAPPSAKNVGVVDHDAAVHHHQGSGAGGPPSGVFVDAGELEPEGGSLRGQRVVDDPGQLGAPPEHVDEIDAAGDVPDPPKDPLAKDLLLPRIDGHDLVAPLEEVAADAVGVAVGLGREADDRDPSRFGEEPAEGAFVGITEQTSPC